MTFVTLASPVLYLLTPPTIYHTLTKPPAYGLRARSSRVAVPAAFAWCVFELPNVVIPIFIIRRQTEQISHVSGVLLILFLLHYIHRAIIYPLCKPPQSSPLPVHIVLSASAFTCFNATLQTLSLHQTTYSPDFTLFQLVCILFFFVGMIVNVATDYHLLALRARADHSDGSSVQRPRGGLFKIVVCPNYLGEIIEWVAWAFACGTWAAGGFAVYTTGFLGARAIVRKEYYRKSGDRDFVNVSAIIPGVL